MLPFCVSLGAEHEHVIPSKLDNNKNLIFVFYILRPFSLSHKSVPVTLPVGKNETKIHKRNCNNGDPSAQKHP